MAKVDWSTFASTGAGSSTNKINNAESKNKVRKDENLLRTVSRKNDGLRDQLFRILGAPVEVLKTTTGLNTEKHLANSAGVQTDTKSQLKSAAANFLGNPVVTQLFDIIDTPRAALISGVNEAAKLLNNNIVHNPSFQPSNKGFLDNMWDNMSTGELLTQNTGIAKFARDHPKTFGLSTLLADVAVDPLPKFKLRVGKPLAQEALAAEYVSQYADDVVKGASAQTLMTKARTAAQQAAAGTGKNAALLINDPKIQESAIAATAGDLGRTAGAATAAMSQEGKYVSLHFGDYELGRSRLAYKPVAAAKRVMANSFLDQALNPKSGVTEAFHTAQRQAEIYGSHQFIQHEAQVRKLFDGLKSDELRQLALTREGGLPPVNAILSNGKPAAQMLKEIDDVFQGMWNVEVASGLHAGKAYDPTYVFKHMMTSDPAKARIAKAASTLGEAELLGGKPLTRIDDILSARLGKHYADIAQSSFVKQIEGLYGHNVDDIVDASKQMASRYKYTEKQARGLMDQALKDAGYKPVTGRAKEFMKPGTMIPDTISTALDKYFKITTHPDEMQKVLNYFDKAQKQWKFIVTVPNPSHHFRNFLSDILSNYYDDVAVTSYGESARMISGKKFTVKAGKFHISNKMLDDFYHTTGASAGFTAMEFNAPSHFRLKSVARSVSDTREDFVRRAHFIDAFKKEAREANNWGELKQAAERARDRVWTFNHDYGSTTDFQRNYLGRVMPFYSWLRKNTELQLTTLLKRPGKLSIMPRMTNAIETLLGQDPSEKQAMEWYMPEWMRELSPIQVRGGENPLYSTLNLPMQDPFKLVGDFNKGPMEGVKGLGKELLNSSSVGIKAPLEFLTGESLLTGAPQTPKQQLVRAIPASRILSNYIPALREETDKPSTQEWISVWNWLTGSGIQELSDPRKQQGLKERKRIIDAKNKKLEEKLMRGIYG